MWFFLLNSLHLIGRSVVLWNDIFVKVSLRIVLQQDVSFIHICICLNSLTIDVLRQFQIKLFELVTETSSWSMWIYFKAVKLTILLNVVDFTVLWQKISGWAEPLHLCELNPVFWNTDNFLWQILRMGLGSSEFSNPSPLSTRTSHFSKRRPAESIFLCTSWNNKSNY